MAVNQEMCTDHDRIIANADFINGSAAADITDYDIRLNTNNNNMDLNGLKDLDLDAPHLSHLSSLPLPVYTSTPTIQRPYAKLFDSTVAFPKLDSTFDSGVGDTFHSSPSISETASPVVSELDSLSASDYLEADARAVSSPSLSSKPGIHRKRFKSPTRHERISSTPISQVLFGQSLVSSALNSKPYSFGDSKMTISPLQSGFNVYRQSGENVPRGSSPEHHPGGKKLCKEINSIWTDRVGDSELTDDEAYFSHSDSKLSASFLSPCSVDELSLRADHALSLSMVLKKFSPPVPDRLIGRNLGEEHFDIFTGLYSHAAPASGVIPWLDKYLAPIDFLRMSCVCWRWREICLNNKLIIRYRKHCARLYGSPDNKENTSQTRLKLLDSAEPDCMTRSSGHLGHVQPAVPTPVKLLTSTPTLYEQTRNTLRWGDSLRHCPFCHSVSKITEGTNNGVCQNQRCGVEFCLRCHSVDHGSSPCKVVIRRGKMDSVGSKKCKKNLRRLANLL
ncbi:uncharacterized protein [Littorina saxatilis]